MTTETQPEDEKTKQTIVGILWAIGIIMMVKSGPLGPGAVTYAGFTFG